MNKLKEEIECIEENEKYSLVESYIVNGDILKRPIRPRKKYTNKEVSKEITLYKNEINIIEPLKGYYEFLNKKIINNHIINDYINSEKYAKTHNHKKKKCKRSEEDWFCKSLEILADEILMVDKMNLEKVVKEEMLNDPESDLTFTQRMSKKYEGKTILSKNAQSNNSIREIYIHEEKYKVAGSISINQFENEVGKNNAKVTKLLKREVTEEDFKKYDLEGALTNYQEAIVKLKERLIELSTAPTVNNSADDNSNVNNNYISSAKVSQGYIDYINSKGYLKKWINELTYQQYQVKEMIRKPARSNNTKSDVNVYVESFGNFEFSNVSEINTLFKMKGDTTLYSLLKNRYEENGVAGNYIHTVLIRFDELVGKAKLDELERDVVDVLIEKKIIPYKVEENKPVYQNLMESILEYIYRKHRVFYDVRRLENAIKKISRKIVYLYLDDQNRPIQFHKTCTKCNELKPLNERNFYPDVKKADGYKNKCIACQREEDRMRHKKNKKEMG